MEEAKEKERELDRYQGDCWEAKIVVAVVAQVASYFVSWETKELPRMPLEVAIQATVTEHVTGKCRISVTFVGKVGDKQHIKVPIGMSLLEAAHENDIDLEGACEGSLACSTCHVILMDEENDMLDLAFGLTETSRLGCQVITKPELDGLRLAIPSAT
ncbi:similar to MITOCHONDRIAL FERREDOXIN 2 [Actinidia rufa]|uniref:Similar to MITOCHONDRIAL FERREDOXIN 2 n=1 Tax=Actinidia rufa TaxID=165716 RepID=A0A7J0G092_9ERIC|nr:similar to MITOCHONDRIAL FERREDOXIN 2 [Actinidia rufa]